MSGKTPTPPNSLADRATGLASAYADKNVPRCRRCTSALNDEEDDLTAEYCNFCAKKQGRSGTPANMPGLELANASQSLKTQPASTQVQTNTIPGTHEVVPEGHVLLGHTEGAAGLTLDLRRLVAGRCLVQGSSGAGKSKTLRRLIEQAHSYTTIVILDIEGEFKNLTELMGAVSVKAAETATDGLTALAVRIRQHRIPLHLDLTDLEPDIRIAKASAFLAGLIACPREMWKNTVMVVIDEAHVLAPQVAASARDAEMRRLGVATLTDLCSRGRKRGICPVIATQRLAKLSSSVVSELQNVLIGQNVFDRDIARAADILGYSNDKASLLRNLTPGQFIALGPALSRRPTRVQIAETMTEHLGAAPELLPSAGHDAETAHKLLQVDALRDVGGASQLNSQPISGGGRAILDTFLLEPAGSLAVRVIGALRPISPNAATIPDLCRHLTADRDDVQSAIDLLSRLGAVDAMPRADDRIVRLSARLRLRLSNTQVVGLS